MRVMYHLILALSWALVVLMGHRDGNPKVQVLVTLGSVDFILIYESTPNKISMATSTL